jgi:hypothetical protein
MKYFYCMTLKYFKFNCVIDDNKGKNRIKTQGAH